MRSAPRRRVRSAYPPRRPPRFTRRARRHGNGDRGDDGAWAKQNFKRVSDRTRLRTLGRTASVGRSAHHDSRRRVKARGLRHGGICAEKAIQCTLCCSESVYSPCSRQYIGKIIRRVNNNRIYILRTAGKIFSVSMNF